MAHKRHTKSVDGLYHRERSELGSVLACREFLNAVERRVPRAIAALRALLAVPGPEVKERIIAWAADHHLISHGRVPRWIVSAASSKLQIWSSHPKALGWCLGASDWNLLPESATRIPVKSWDPSAETRREATDRVYAEIEKRFDQIEAAARDAGDQTPEKRQLEHFNWAARFQVGNEDVAAIVEGSRGARYGRERLNERIVRLGIADVLRLIDIDRRRVRPGPKP